MSDLTTSRITGISYAKELLEKHGDGALNQLIDLLDLVLTKTNGYPEEAVRMLGELKDKLEDLSNTAGTAPCGGAYPPCCSKSVGWVYALLGSIVGGLIGAAIAVVIIFLFFA